jgi:hypothetical protein
VRPFNDKEEEAMHRDSRTKWGWLHNTKKRNVTAQMQSYFNISVNWRLMEKREK